VVGVSSHAFQTESDQILKTCHIVAQPFPALEDTHRLALFDKAFQVACGFTER